MSCVVRVLTCVLFVVALASGGCGPDAEILEANMRIFRARVEAVTDTTATLAWETNLPGDSKVDFSLLGEASTGAGDLESVSDENYVPLFLDGGVTVEPDFEHVSNTRYEKEFTHHHRVVLDDLLPARTYTATVSSNNYLGARAHELGVRLLFTTDAAP